MLRSGKFLVINTAVSLTLYLKKHFLKKITLLKKAFDVQSIIYSTIMKLQ